MEVLLRILAPLVNLYGNDIATRKIQYWQLSDNLVIRLLICLLLLSFVGSLLFYLLGRFVNLKKNWHWFLVFVALAALQTLYMRHQVFEYVWRGDLTKALDIDYALILSPILILFMLYMIFSKLWLSIPNLTIFSIYTPSFLSKK